MQQYNSIWIPPLITHCISPQISLVCFLSWYISFWVLQFWIEVRLGMRTPIKSNLLYTLLSWTCISILCEIVQLGVKGINYQGTFGQLFHIFIWILQSILVQVLMFSNIFGLLTCVFVGEGLFFKGFWPVIGRRIIYEWSVLGIHMWLWATKDLVE
jgi:hypothetical protein